MRTGSPGIHEQLIAKARNQLAMRVTEDDDIGVVSRGKLCRRRATDFVAVADVHADPVDVDEELAGKIRLIRRVRVAEDGFDGRDQPELVQYFGPADITRMKYQLDPRQCGVDARPKQPMRIGDESHNVRFGVCHVPFYILEP